MPNAIVVCCPLLSFPVVVRCPNLHAIIVRHCCSLPPLLSTFAIVRHCRYPLQPQPSSPLCCLCCLSPPALILPCQWPSPHLTCHHCPPQSLSTFAVIIRHRRLPLAQPSSPLHCLSHLSQSALALPCCSPLPNLACHHHLPPLLSPIIVVCCCCCCPLLPPSAAAAITATLLSPPSLATVSCCHFSSPSVLRAKMARLLPF